ncbi:hypothetical protein GCM10011512_12730 [Tersicoccus solisilvae]|uniref:Polysaccharide biosynthesis protein n=1 Tax=Tersicoccus solisilvae TaxID=1882339 RepID=A0ABQ1P1T0_9MICC|nr:hypothetical protein [Tersicoccus solisilvae]GGC87261.1 hypothetical protein GCM10011512_12730 [Tersicoccus solisilvae]
MTDAPDAGTAGATGTADAAGPAPRARTGRASLLYLIGALAQGLGMFLVQPFAIRVLADDVAWQELYLSISLIQVGVVLASAGLPLAITRAWFDTDGHRRARSISGFLTGFGLLLGVLAAAVFAAVRGGAPGTSTFSLALVAMGVQSSVLAAQAILRAQGRAVAFVGLSIGSSVLAYLVGLVAMLVVAPDPTVFMAGYGAVLLLTGVVAALITGPVLPFTVPGAIRESLAIGLPVLPHTGALMLLTQGAPFLLAFLAAAGLSGDYGKVQIFVLGTITLLNALNNAWVPELMRVDREQRDARLRSIMGVASWAALGIVVVAAAGANVVTHVLAVGREDLIPVAQAMTLGTFGYALYLNASTLLFADKRTWVLPLVTPVVLVVSAGIAWLPAAAGNLVGTAVASAVSFTLLGLAYLAVVWRRSRRGWPLGRLAAVTAAGLGYVLVLMLLPRDVVTGLVTVAVVGVAGGTGAVLVLLRRRRRAATA